MLMLYTFGLHQLISTIHKGCWLSYFPKGRHKCHELLWINLHLSLNCTKELIGFYFRCQCLQQNFITNWTGNHLFAIQFTSQWFGIVHDCYHDIIIELSECKGLWWWWKTTALLFPVVAYETRQSINNTFENLQQSNKSKQVVLYQSIHHCLGCMVKYLCLHNHVDISPILGYNHNKATPDTPSLSGWDCTWNI